MSRPPNYEFQEWWNKQRAKETAADPLLPSSTSEDSRFLSVDIHGPTSPAAVAAAAGKDRSRSARQLSRIYLLKLHKIAHSFTFLATGCITLVRTARESDRIQAL
ncbi:Cellulose-synthase-like C6 [Salvia divinorum]|uniref:Cellulose-synthase-like C6 n=1 Tax=Salvia divinorum TaxID=28513 RepID=A0ABD1GKC6_SALDI